MKKKILFWLDAGLIEFGIAKFINKDNNFELYAINDFNYPLSDSFKNQKIVSFKKEWFYWKEISGSYTKPDLNYLKSFEDNYGINLWTLIYSERNFNEHNPFYKFNHDELCSILEKECKFFESVLDKIKPNYLIIKLTDFHRNHLLAEMCKKNNVKIFSLIPAKVGFRAQISSRHQEFEELYSDEMNDKSDYKKSFNVEDYISSYNRLAQTKKIISGGSNLSINKKIKSALKLLIAINKNFVQSYDRFGVTRFSVLYTFFKFKLKAKYRKSFIDKNFLRKIIDKNIIFYPLQVQPERTIDLDAPYFSDQITVIENIAKSLPVDYVLYVKEHYNMDKREWRKISEYKQIMELSNVKLIHPSVSPVELIKKSKLVVTISSTAGLEAAYYGKPSILFTTQIYSTLPSVTIVKSFENLPTAIRTSLEQKVNVSDTKNFLKILDKNTFEFDVFELYTIIGQRFHNSGFIVSLKISMTELNDFYNENKKIFEKLCTEFLNAIKNYEQKPKKRI